jgi:hypothetical protein
MNSFTKILITSVVVAGASVLASELIKKIEGNTKDLPENNMKV